MGPPLLKLSIRKFPVSVVLDVLATVFAVAAGAGLPVVVAGVITAVAGVMPAAGDIAGAAGVTIVAGFAGDVAGADCGVWLKEVSTSVKKQRLAISNVFIG